VLLPELQVNTVAATTTRNMSNDIGRNARSNTTSINNIIRRDNNNGNNKDDDRSISNGSSCSDIRILILNVDIISPSVSS
jgi:hypothetical protein